MRSQINYLFRKSFISKWWVDRKRKKALASGASKKYKTTPNQSVRELFAGLYLKKNIMFLLTSCVLVIIILAHVNQYFNIAVQPYFENDRQQRLIVDPQKINILMIGIKQRDEYRFIESMQVLRVDMKNDEAQLFAIPTMYIVATDTGSYPLRNFFNNIDTTQDRMDQLLTSVESLLGISLDRYIAFDVDEFKDYLKASGFKYRLPLNLSLESRDFKIGDEVSGSYLYSYLFDTKTTKDVVIEERQNDFWKYYFRKNFGNLRVYRLFWSPETLTDLFKTNLTISEALNLVRDFNNLKISSSVPGGSSNQFWQEEEIGIKPDYLQIDEDIQQLSDNVAVIKEQAEVEVYNATGKAGQAYYKTRELQNLGINVVKYNNYFEDSKENLLYIIDPDRAAEFNSTITAIRSSLRDDLKIKIGGYKYNNSGDLILILGK